MNSTNFSELYSRIQEWSADDEDILLRKLKQFADNYSKKCEEIHGNVENINKNINLIEIEYNNASNKLKNISIKRFMEHIVEENGQLAEETKPQRPKENLVILSKEERERNILNKFKSSITKSLENLNIKNLIDIKENNDNDSILDDDNISVTSSKYFQSLQKQKNLNIKLPYIIGTIDYFKNEYLGVATSQTLLGTMMENRTLSNLSANAVSGNVNFAEKNFSSNNNNSLQQNYCAKNSNSNPSNNYANSNGNLDKMSMNMNLIEQIYERKNSYNPAAAEDQLSELLFKNRKNDVIHNKNNNNNTNDFFDDANKLMNDQFKNIYTGNDKKNQTVLQDPNFVDFTKMNNLNYNNNLLNSNINIIGKEELFIKDENQVGFGLPITNEPLIPTNKEEKLFINENNNDFKNLNNKLLIPNRRITLDTFVKRGNLFDANVIDNEEDDDNTGLFDKNKEAKFNMLIKNNKNTIIADQETNAIEDNNRADKEQIKNQFKNFSDNNKEENAKSNFKDTEEKLGNILRDSDEEYAQDNSEKKQENRITKALISHDDSEKQRNEEKSKAEKNKNKPLTNNLFSESGLDEEEGLFTNKKMKNENTKPNRTQKETKEPKTINEKADNKTSLQKAKNTLKMLFDEDDDETDNTQKNILVVAEKIDKKSNNLTEKLNNLLDSENDKKENNDIKLLSIESREEKKKNDLKTNVKSQKSKGLLVFEEEEENEDLKFNLKPSSNKNPENKENSKSETNEIKPSLPKKNEFASVFEDIFADTPKLIGNEINLKEKEEITQNSMKKSELIVEKEKTEVKINLFDFGAEPKEKEESKKTDNENATKASKDLLEIFTNSAKEKNEESDQQILKSKKNLEFLSNLEAEGEETLKIENSKTEIKIDDGKKETSESDLLNEDKKIKLQDVLLHRDNLNSQKEKEILNSNENKQEANPNFIEKNDNTIIPETKPLESAKIDLQNEEKEEEISQKEQLVSDLLVDDAKEKSKGVIYEEEVYAAKSNRRPTNTMIKAENLPGLDRKDSVIPAKAKINFDDIENEDTEKSIIKPIAISEMQDKVKKQAINFDDPLKPLNKKSSKDSPKRKKEIPKAVEGIKGKSLVKNVFEDSEEEKIVSNPKKIEVSKLEVVQQSDEKKDGNTLEKPEIPNLLDKEHTEVKNEDKEIQSIVPEVKSEEKRRSIKVNKFSEIQKLLNMKLQKPNLPEINDTNFFIPMKAHNHNTVDKMNDKRFQEDKSQILSDHHFDISVVKNKKKPMLKKFSLLSTTNNEEKNKEKPIPLEEENSPKCEKPNEKALGRDQNQENFKALLDKKIQESKTESLREKQCNGELKEESSEMPLINYQAQTTQVVNDKDNFEKNANNKEDDGGEKNDAKEEKHIQIEKEHCILTAEVQKSTESLEINNDEKNKNEFKKEEPLPDKNYANNKILLNPESSEKNIKPEEIQSLNENDKIKLEQEAPKLEENQKIQEIENHTENENRENLSHKSTGNDQAPIVNENPHSIKKVKKIEFNDDIEDENEKIIERKSKDFLAKKKDSEKIKALKNKAKNTSNTIKPRLSSNFGANKTLNFDEEDE